MKGKEEVINLLNELLADELTAINQYIVHAEMCANWGLSKLYQEFKKRAIDEMRHAEKFIERILFLEGRPVVSKLNEIHVGETVEKQLRNDLSAELEAVKQYNEAIALATRLGDNGTKDIFEEVLADEERHVDELETELEKIAHMGLENYLTTKV